MGRGEGHIPETQQGEVALTLIHESFFTEVRRSMHMAIPGGRREWVAAVLAAILISVPVAVPAQSAPRDPEAARLAQIRLEVARREAHEAARAVARAEQELAEARAQEETLAKRLEEARAERQRAEQALIEARRAQAAAIEAVAAAQRELSAVW